MPPGKRGRYRFAAAGVFGLPGYLIGRTKGRAAAGFWLGFVLSVIGLIIIACLPADREALILREQEKIRIQQEAAARMGGDS